MLGLVHAMPASIFMSVASTPDPVVVTIRFPDARSFSRSVTFRFAMLAVGEHTPPEQFMFCVAAVEIVTAAFEAPPNAASERPARKTMTDRRRDCE
jgi:hypothetical protein